MNDDTKFHWCYFLASILSGLIIALVLGEVTDRILKRRISRTLFLHAHLCSAVGSQCLLLFFQYMLIFSRYEKIGEMWLVATLTCSLAIIGPLLNMLYSQLIKKSQLSVPLHIQPEIMTFIVLFSIASSFALLLNYFFELQVFECLNWKALWFLLTILYGYLTLDGWYFLRIAMKVESFDVLDEGRIVGELTWKNGEWVEFVESIEDGEHLEHKENKLC